MADLTYGIDTAFTSGTTKIPFLVSLGKTFVIIKATQDDFEDGGFKGSLRAARDAALVPFAFHFLIHSVKVPGFRLDASISATAQANNFLDTINTRNSGYDKIGYALDIENFTRHTKVHGKSVVSYKSVPKIADVDDFVARFRARLPDAHLLLYTRSDIWGAMGNHSIQTRYDNKVHLWLADWTGHPDFTLTLGRLFPTIHQYKVDYLSGHRNLGRTDLDASQRTRSQLKALAQWTTTDPGDPPGDPEDPPDDGFDPTGSGEIGCEDETGPRNPPPDGTPEISATDSESVGGTLYDVAITYDAEELYNGTNDTSISFTAEISPLNQDDAVEFDWTTQNGTAIAGTHYVADSGHATVAAGDGSFSVDIDLLSPAAVSGDKAFSVVISNPGNAVIVRPVGELIIHYAVIPDPHPWLTLDHFDSMPNYSLVYNEFADPTHRNQCTSHAGALVATVQHFLATGNEAAYNPVKLFRDAGGPPCPEGVGDCLPSGHCCGFQDTKILRWMKLHGVTRKNPQNAKFVLASWNMLSADTVDNLVIKVKKGVYQQGCVYLSSIFYSDWNSAGSHAWSHGKLPSHGSAKSSIGHSWVVVGWDDSIDGTGVGGFRLQSSHGAAWADHGRAWLPYSYIVRRSVGNGGSGADDPWYRFFRVIPKTS